MANATYQSGTVTVGTTPTLICSPDCGNGGVALYASASGVAIGGSSVTSTTGPVLPATTIVNFPTSRGPTDLYGVVASGTATVSFAWAPAFSGV